MFENTLDALSLEYKLEEGCAFGYLRVSDIVNNTFLFSKIDVFSGSFQKEATDFLGVNVGSFGDYVAD